jgi:riboflavin biosynthesis pyrimidine reductase
MLAPFEVFVAAGSETAIRQPLPPELRALYGELSFPRAPRRPYVISNFVSTLDGVVSLGLPGKSGGGPISGFNQHDRALMGLLRAVSGAIVVGAGTLRAVPKHLWTAEYVFPDLRDAFQAVRRELGLGQTPLNVILTGSGHVDLSAPVFASRQVETLIVTTPAGATGLRAQALPPGVSVRAVESTEGGRFGAGAVLTAIADCLGQPPGVVLVEGGPQVMGDFLAENLIDELFLTLAPQVAGRDDTVGERPALVAGRLFAPEQPVWSTLVSVHQADSHLFLRYRLGAAAPTRSVH